MAPESFLKRNEACIYAYVGSIRVGHSLANNNNRQHDNELVG
jgi:hypothetical protein